MKKQMVVLKVVGALATTTAALGLLCNGLALPTLLMNRPYNPDTPYFLPAFLIMSGLCIGFYVILLVFGIQFVRGRTGLIRMFSGLMVCEVIYFLSVSFLWLMPGIGRSIGAATGVANGGLMFQAVILFPLWAPFAVKWAKRTLEDKSSKTKDPDCIFCKIVAGQIPCCKVREDDACLAFMDVGPLAEGHVLLIPKGHYVTVDQMPADLAGRMLQHVPSLVGAVRKATGCQGVNVLQNNGPVAHQVLPHVHFHVIPRSAGDAFGFNWPAGTYPKGRMQELAEEIRRNLQ